MNIKKQSISGYTLVEVIVVIVVIAILASITVITYSGVRNRAVDTSLQSDLNNASDKLVISQTKSSTGDFPATLNDTDINFSKNNNPSYKVNNATSPKTFCLTLTNDNRSYFTTQEGVPQPGPCPSLYFDAQRQTSYPGSGTSWYDLSGYGANAVANGISYNSSGVKALVFNGTNQYFTVPGASNINPATNGVFSISVWVNPNTLSSTWYRGIIVQEAYLASGYRFGIYLDGRVGFWTTQSGGTLSVMTTSNNIPANQWKNIVVTYNNQNASVYINGILSGTGTGTYISGNNDLRVGSIISEYFSGSMADVKFYNNKALSQEEIKASFEALRGRFGV